MIIDALLLAATTCHVQIFECVLCLWLSSLHVICRTPKLCGCACALMASQLAARNVRVSCHCTRPFPMLRMGWDSCRLY